MGMIDKVKAKAKANKRCIVLPEGDEPRTVQAAAIVAAEGYAEPVLLGNPDAVLKIAEETGTDLTGIRITIRGKAL